jgi:hypothetical protein
MTRSDTEVNGSMKVDITNEKSITGPGILNSDESG